MKINTKFWVLIIFGSLIIIFLKSYKFNFKKDYYFDRNITKTSILKPIKIPILDSIKNHDFILATDNIITVYESQLPQNNSINIKQYDIIKKTIVKNFKTTLPIGTISFVNNDNLFYIDKFQLLSKNIISNKISSISKLNLKIFNAFPISNINEYIILGEIKMAGLTKVAFIKYNTITNISKVIREININNEGTNRNFLMSNGVFSKNSNYITYTFNKSSKIFVFNKNGNFINQINTKENVPNPEIIEFNGSFGYKRGATYSTNIATFIKNDDVYILSERINEDKKIIIDRYSLKNGKYKNSFALNNTEYGNKKVNNIFQIGNLIIINSSSDFKSYVLK